MLIDPQSSYVQNAVQAMRRAQDDEILQAFYAASATGENGTTATSFPAGQIVGVNVGGTGSNLNVAKLRAAKKLLLAAGVDFEAERAYVAITAADHDALLNEVQVVSSDFNSKPVLVDGMVTSFMGFQFVNIEHGDSASYDAYSVMTSGSNRLLPCWVPSGMHLGMWQDVQTRVDQRPDKRYSTQCYAKTTIGATRIEELKVVQITTTG